MKPHLTIIIITILLLTTTVLADNTYPTTGGDGYDFDLTSTRGTFNSERGDNYLRFSKSLFNPRHVPLVEDLNNDGTNEIIVLDNPTIKVFRNRTLDTVDFYTLTQTEEHAPLLIYDIDGDSLKEIITYELVGRNTDYASAGGAVLSILELNASGDLNLQKNYTLTGNPSTGNRFITTEAIMQCTGTEQCMIFGTERLSSTFRTYARKFNSTQNPVVADFLEIQSSGTQECFPRTPVLVPADYDDDGITELIFSHWETGGTFDDNVIIRYFNIQDITPTVEQTIFQDQASSPAFGDCITPDANGHMPSAKFTAPLVMDIDGGGALETVVAQMTDADEFKMYSYDSLGGFIDDYPEVFEVDGVLLSNVIKADVFIDTDNKDFCVLGYQYAIQRLDLVCASEQLSGVETEEAIVDSFNFQYNVSVNRPPMNTTWSNAIHAVQHDSSTATSSGSNPKDLDEILTPYGVFKTNIVTAQGIGSSPLERIWTAFGTEGAVIQANPEGHTSTIGTDDLLHLTDSGLFYYDDLFTNSQGQITEYTINPCIDSAWQVNTTVRVELKVEDFDTDDVSSRAILYDQEVNEADEGWSLNASSGTTFVFEFVANKTTTGSILTMKGRDVENADQSPNSISVGYSVQNTGLEFGDCQTTQVITLEDPVTGNDTIVDSGAAAGTNLEDNSIINGLNMFTNFTGLGAGLLFLIGFIIMAWHISMERSFNFHQKLALIGVSFVLMMIVGTFLGIIPVGVIIVIALMLLVLVGWALSRNFFSQKIE